MDEVVELDVEEVGDRESADEVIEGVNDALAQFAEVLHQAHAWQLGAISDCLACAIDRICWVEFSHAVRPRGCAISAES